MFKSRPRERSADSAVDLSKSDPATIPELLRERLARNRAEIEDYAARYRQLASQKQVIADESAKLTLSQAAMEGLYKDPHATPEQIASARERVKADRDALQAAQACRESNPDTDEGLGALTKELAEEREFLEAELMKAHYELAVEKYVVDLLVLVKSHDALFAQFAAANKRYPEAVTLSDGRTIKRRAGLPDLFLPAAIVHNPPADFYSGADGLIAGTLVQRHILRGVGEYYPHLLLKIAREHHDLLTEAEASAILEKIEADRRRGSPRWWPAPYRNYGLQPFAWFGW